MALLQVDGISKHITGKKQLSGISFAQEKGEKIAIAGETGSGKTTLLRLIAGLEQADEGSIYFNDRRVKGSLEQLLPGHPQIAYLSQHFELRNNYWVREILAYANEWPEKEVQELYAICRIDHLLNRRTDQLSGGEKQRIALARLVSSSPQLLLLDEPFSNLDAQHKKIIKSVVEDIRTKLSISMILVSHDPADLLSWANRIIILKDGQIEQSADPLTCYHKPANEYCAGLFGEYNVFHDPTTTGKQSFSRPEYFYIANSSGKNMLTGTVRSVVFEGHSYVYLIDTPLGSIQVRWHTNSFQPGEVVFLDQEKNQHWFV